MQRKLFAVWTETPTKTMTTSRIDPLDRQWSETMQITVRRFITDIPTEAGQDHVIERVGLYVDPECGHPGEIVRSGFYEEWPADVTDEFRDPESGAEKLSWSKLPA